MEKVLSKDGSQKVTDEQINSASHIVAAVFALMGATLLIVYAAISGNAWKVVSFSIYGASLLILFIASSLHHGIKGRHKVQKFLKASDYYAIFLLIAGTMTPICLVLLRGPFGWSLFGVVWTVATTGILLKSLLPDSSKWVTSTLYLAMGWLGILTVIPLYKLLGLNSVLVLATGGVLYSFGAVIFIVEKPNPAPGKFGFHEIWHLFVIAAALAHYMFMYIYVLGFPE